MSADTADKILSSDWIVKSQPVLWLAGEPFKRRISKVETDKQTNKHTDKLIWELVELLTFAVKNQFNKR